MKNILNSDFFKTCLYLSCIFIFINIFNTAADIYNMTFVHRFVCILSISFVQTFSIPFYKLFNKELHK